MPSHKLLNQELTRAEKELQGLFRTELQSRFQIGYILSQIKKKKLYKYQKMEDITTWRDWTMEFIGSTMTANRYLSLYEVFIERFKYSPKDLEKISPSYLYSAVPMLEGKTKEEADEVLNIAESSPTLNEFKKAVLVKGKSIEEIMDCKHNWKKIKYQRCTLCDATKPYED
jgi:LPS O-antigen subunit length determinant protein (WzzB/FepE family)